MHAHATTRDSWTLTGKSGSVSCGVIAPFSWVLVHTRFYLCPPESIFPVLCKFWWLYFGIKHNLFQEDLCHTQVCCTQSPCLAAGHCWPTPSQEILKHGSSSVSVGSPGPGAHKICALWVSLAGIWFDSKHDFTPPTILLGFSFTLGCRVSFFGGIQRSPVDGCSAVNCNFGVLAENESTSFYFASYI